MIKPFLTNAVTDLTELLPRLAFAPRPDGGDGLKGKTKTFHAARELIRPAGVT